jgi:single-strand DNA-binding protein
MYGLDVDEIGPSLRFATASVKKMTRTRAGDGFVPADVPDDVWDTAVPASARPVSAAA